MLYMTPWVTRIILINVAVFVLTLIAPQTVLQFVLIPEQMFTHPWTVITYMFLHAGFSHILFNMLSLFFFGPRLEVELGGKNFLILYFASGISGALLSFLSPTSAIVGASGAIYGVMLGYAYLWPRDRVFIWGLVPVEVRLLVIVMTALSLFGGFTGMSGGIAHFAHLGGFLGGFVVMKALYRPRGVHPAFQTAPVQSDISADDVARWKAIPRERLHEVNREEYDRIMTKLTAGGPQILTPQEITFLKRFSAQ